MGIKLDTHRIINKNLKKFQKRLPKIYKDASVREEFNKTLVLCCPHCRKQVKLTIFG